MKNDDAVKYEQLSYIDALQQLQYTRFHRVFALHGQRSPHPSFQFERGGQHSPAILGEKVGTLVCSES